MSFTALYKLLVPFVAHDSRPHNDGEKGIRANRLFRSADKRRRARRLKREKLSAGIRERERQREREKSIRGGCKIARSSVGRSPVFIHDFARGDAGAVASPVCTTCASSFVATAATTTATVKPPPPFALAFPALPPHHAQGRTHPRASVIVPPRNGRNG